MLSKLVDFMRLKLSCGILFDIVYLLRFPWWGGKNSLVQEMIINPTYNLNVIANLTDRNNFRVVRGVGLSEVQFDQNLIVDLLISIAKCKGNHKREQTLLSTLPSEIMNVMEYADILVKAKGAPKAVRYFCKLELGSLVHEIRFSRASFVLNDNFYHQTDKQIPLEVMQFMYKVFDKREFELKKIFDVNPPMLWTIDSCTQFINPIHLNSEQSNIISKLQNGQIELTALSEEMFILLKELDIIIEPKSIEARQLAFEKSIEDARLFLAENDYVTFNNCFNSIQTFWQREYYKKLVAGGYFFPTDFQVLNRKSIHNEYYSRFLHFQINKIVNKILGNTVVPSYSFLAHYYEGAELKKHIDRAQCEWNISMPLDTSPDGNIVDSWPIYIQTNNEKTVEIKLDLGDVVIYRGNRLYHWRKTLDIDKTATICFFHFVNPDFQGSLE